MHIIELQSENFKRLKAVRIRPDGRVVTITGKNGQGKSSVLDSIWAALGGADVMPPAPIRDGADKAAIRLDLGEYVVTRKISRRDDGEVTTSLTVEGRDGMRAKSPQALLNDLVGRFSLDPLEFSRMAPKAQFDALKVFVPGLDLEAMAAKNADDYERRTIENRKAKEAEAAAAAIICKAEKVEKIDTSQILADMARASDHNAGIEERRARRLAAEKEADEAEARNKSDEAVLQQLQEQMDKVRARMTADKEKAARLRQRLAEAAPLPALLDTAKLAEALQSANSVNEEAERQAKRRELEQVAAQHKAAADALTEAMKARDEEKQAAITAAKFPVPGLSLGDGEVLVNGQPFIQAATSEKIRTSVSLAMAMNPKVRVIRIMDGSLLDSDTMKVIAGMAEAEDFQVWVETVSDGDGPGIIIEDGHIKEA